MQLVVEDEHPDQAQYQVQVMLSEVTRPCRKVSNTYIVIGKYPVSMVCMVVLASFSGLPRRPVVWCSTT